MLRMTVNASISHNLCCVDSGAKADISQQCSLFMDLQQPKNSLVTDSGKPIHPLDIDTIHGIHETPYMPSLDQAVLLSVATMADRVLNSFVLFHSSRAHLCKYLDIESLLDIDGITTITSEP